MTFLFDSIVTDIEPWCENRLQELSLMKQQDPRVIALQNYLNSIVPFENTDEHLGIFERFRDISEEMGESGLVLWANISIYHRLVTMELMDKACDLAVKNVLAAREKNLAETRLGIEANLALVELFQVRDPWGFRKEIVESCEYLISLGTYDSFFAQCAANAIIDSRISIDEFEAAHEALEKYLPWLERNRIDQGFYDRRKVILAFEQQDWTELLERIQRFDFDGPFDNSNMVLAYRACAFIHLGEQKRAQKAANKITSLDSRYMDFEPLREYFVANGEVEKAIDLQLDDFKDRNTEHYVWGAAISALHLVRLYELASDFENVKVWTDRLSEICQPMKRPLHPKFAAVL